MRHRREPWPEFIDCRTATQTTQGMLSVVRRQMPHLLWARNIGHVVSMPCLVWWLANENVSMIVFHTNFLTTTILMIIV